MKVSHQRIINGPLATRLLALAIIFLLGLFLSFPLPVKAERPYQRARVSENLTSFSSPRFTLYIGGEKPAKERVNANDIAEKSFKILNQTYDELSRIFKTRPTKKVVLRFLPPEEFRRQTGAPEWTSAMYFRNEITIPLTKTTGWDEEELHRALRHEYVHAVVAELSNYKCPAWMDEGIAQLLEGQINPLLGPALRKWIAVNQAIPLDWLHNGFTTLDAAYVPAAYAQSLFAVRKLIQTNGFSSVGTYLQHLQSGKSERRAFHLAFGMKKSLFEQELTREIRRWSHSRIPNP